ncbi:MAG: glycerophosphodiester phosphodiesterase family protein, partial [Oscillospiraceae bacterium]|nr:glycerophosphodiester phosphodiesterase family protein [Oscillospiraceae bacterium]
MSFSDTRKTIWGNTRKLLFHNWPLLVLGQLLILIVFILAWVPLMALLFRLTLKATGFSYVTLDNLQSFLLHPLSLLMLVVLFLLLSLFLLWELYYLTGYFSAMEQLGRPQPLKLVAVSLARVITGLPQGSLRLLGTEWLNLILFNLPLLAFALWRSRLQTLISNSQTRRLVWLGAGVLLLLMLGWFLWRRIFVLPDFWSAQLTGRQALLSGRSKGRCHARNSLGCLLVWNLEILLVESLIYLLLMVLTMLIVTASFSRNLAIAAFISINESIERYFVFFLFLVSTTANQALVIRLYHFYGLAKTAGFPEENAAALLKIRRPSARRILAVTLVAVLAADTYFMVSLIRNGSSLNAISLADIKLTSHRGASWQAPENTLEAIDLAREQQADYVEIDVRLTSDGVPVILHDSSLRRTTGLNQPIWQTDYATVSQLDAGSWFSPAFAGVKVPTLQEVLEACKGKVKLNLDLKYRSAAEGLAEKVVALIQQYEMAWQCVVTSTSLACLQDVKALDPDIQTGYIGIRLLTGLSAYEGVDFFSMRASLVTQTVVQQIHASGRLICVWTVNNKSELLRLSRIGVDNIITDRPTYAREVLYQSESGNYLLT